MTEIIELTKLEQILTQIHKKLDGKCQKCSQRCDKRVVCVVKNRMLCPDCQLGKDRPMFTVTDRVIEMCARRTGWDSIRDMEDNKTM